MRCVYCGATGTKGSTLVKRSLGWACVDSKACAKRQAVRAARKAKA